MSARDERLRGGRFSILLAIFVDFRCLFKPVQAIISGLSNVKSSRRGGFTRGARSSAERANRSPFSVVVKQFVHNGRANLACRGPQHGPRLFVTDMTDGENKRPAARTGGLTWAGRAAANNQNDLQRCSVRSINLSFVHSFVRRASSAVEALRSRLSNTRPRSNDGPVAQATAGRAV